MADSAEAELELARLALSVAHESVTKQQADIRDLRTAAAALLTGAAVVVALLGGRAIDAHRLPLLVVLGVALFLVSLFCIFTVLVPYGAQLQEIADGVALLDLAEEQDADVEAHERVAATYDAIYTANNAPKRRLVRLLIAAAVLLVAQIATWGATIVLAERDDAPAKATCVAAQIAGELKCLARRQLCDRRHELEYERYGFVCTARAGDGRARLR